MDNVINLGGDDDDAIDTNEVEDQMKDAIENVGFSVSMLSEIFGGDVSVSVSAIVDDEDVEITVSVRK